MQRPRGDFAMLTSRSPSMARARAYECNIYSTALVAYALGRFAELPAAAMALRSAGDFLLAEQNDDGSWSYEGRATWRVPPDLDDTACAVVALHGLGERPGLSFYRLLWENEAAAGGPYYTWAGVNGGAHLLARQVDALVNANVVLAAARAGQRLPGAVSYLLDVTRSDLDGASDYCLTPHLLVYALARACADGPAPELAPAVRAGLAALGPCDDAFRTACRASALLALGEQEAPPELGALLAAQLPDGSWPLAAAYADYPPYHAGSPALSTAVALDALARGLRNERQRRGGDASPVHKPAA
jgi:hypothetical protein